MIALFLVLIISLLVAAAFLGGFIWSVRNDQFEDRQGSAMRMLYDDEPITVSKQKAISQTTTISKQKTP